VLEYAALAEWFADQGITTPFSYDSLPDETPTNAYAISITGGLGLTVEQAFDRPTFQILTRGSNGAVAFLNAMAVDDAILDAEPGFDIGDYRVIDKGRFGGPPAYVATDDRRRVLRAATYYLEIER
jgi:hypothetical protein